MPILESQSFGRYNQIADDNRTDGRYTKVLAKAFIPDQNKGRAITESKVLCALNSRAANVPVQRYKKGRILLYFGTYFKNVLFVLDLFLLIA